MSAKIHARDGQWSNARNALDSHSSSHRNAKGDEGVQELRDDVEEAEKSEKQAKREMQAQLWTACYESATRALRVGAYAVAIREMRAECSLRAGDIESAVGDLSRLTHLRGSTTPSQHLTIFHLSYFFLPLPLSASQNAGLTALKQCLHLDPDSALCLPAHRQLKALEKGFIKVDGMAGRGEWRGLLDFLLGKDRTGGGKDSFLKTYEDALVKLTSPSPSPSRTTTSSSKSAQQPLSLPTPLQPKLSPRLTYLLKHLCLAHTHLSLHRRGLPYCERLLNQDKSLLGEGPGEELDIGDGGRAEALLAQEEWDEAVRVLERAWERGRGEDVSYFLHESTMCSRNHGFTWIFLLRLNSVFRKPNGCSSSRGRRIIIKCLVWRGMRIRGLSKKLCECTSCIRFVVNYFMPLFFTWQMFTLLADILYSRRAARTAHPDKGGSEAKMAAVNEAYEVLSTPGSHDFPHPLPSSVHKYPHFYFILLSRSQAALRRWWRS